MSKLTYEEIKKFLEQAQNRYHISWAAFRDLTGGRTWVTFQLNDMREKVWIDKISVQSPNGGPGCAHTFRELFELLENYHRDNPDGKISFSETGLGISIMFIVKGLNKNLQSDSYKTHTIEEARALPENAQEKSAGCMTVAYDKSMERICVMIQLDESRTWFLRIYFDSATGYLLKYDLDYEGAAYESHYEFKDEAAIRRKMYRVGDEEKYLEDLFIRFIEEHSGFELEAFIAPYVTAQYHYD